MCCLSIFCRPSIRLQALSDCRHCSGGTAKTLSRHGTLGRTLHPKPSPNRASQALGNTRGPLRGRELSIRLPLRRAWGRHQRRSAAAAARCNSSLLGAAAAAAVAVGVAVAVAARSLTSLSRPSSARWGRHGAMVSKRMMGVHPVPALSCPLGKIRSSGEPMGGLRPVRPVLPTCPAPSSRCSAVIPPVPPCLL